MERSPKRQRLNDPYSPASPSPSVDTKHTFVPPQTPPPSVRMSPSWQAQSNTTQQQPTSGSNFPTPPSTAGYQPGHMPGRGASSETGGESGRQTPANEDDSEVRRDSDGDAEMADRQDQAAKDVAAVDAEHRRTDHKRKREDSESSTPSIPGAQTIYQLSTSHIPRVQPHPSQDFIQLYGLQSIQQSVARRDPVTGEKINKLRKSYENKVKNLKLDGRNKAAPNQGELGGLLDPAWNNWDQEQNTTWWGRRTNEARDSKTLLGDSDSHQSLFSKLDAAFNMCSGRFPAKEHKEWENSLGLDDPVAAAGGRTPMGGVSKPAAAIATANAAPGRPDRAGKKRRYNDSSFEGYDGFEDDGSSAKRPKHKDFGSSSRNSPAITGGAGPNGNMVGVTSS